MTRREDQARALRALLEGQRTAALATLHRGDPAVSMVPYALLPDGGGLVLHTSRLAAHTGQMLAHPAVALLVLAPADSAASPRELARASLQGRAERLAEGSDEEQQARAAYLARFPESAPIFELPDFSLFRVAVQSVRHVGGFADATSFSGEDFRRLMSAPG